MLNLDKDHDWFWKDLQEGKWEPDTLRVVQRFAGKGKNFCDMGAWIGPITLCAASLGSTVYSFEPDPQAFKYLQKNVAGNNFKKVFLIPHAIAKENGKMKMAPFFSQLGDSTTSLLAGCKSKAQGIEVECFTWTAACEKFKLPRFDFIKMDIEGAEFEIIENNAAYFESFKPIIHLSIHAPYLSESERMIALERMFQNLTKWGKLEDKTGRQIRKADIISSVFADNFTDFLVKPI